MLFQSVQIGTNINISYKESIFEYFEAIISLGTWSKLDLSTPQPKLLTKNTQRMIHYSLNKPDIL